MTISIAQAAQTTYRFVGLHVRTLLRLTWLPLLISALASTYTDLKLLPYLPAFERKDTATMMASLGPMAGWLAFGLCMTTIMSAVAAVAVMRYVVRGDLGTDNKLVHVAFGVPELRVTAVTIIIAAMMFLAGIPFVLLFELISTVTASPLVADIMPFAIIAGVLVMAARWMMAYPVAAIEDRINFNRAWMLIRPLYPQFLLLIVCLLLPLFILDTAVQLLIAPDRTETVAQMRGAVEANWVVITGWGFVISFLMTTVFFTALGIIYREAAGKPAGLAA